MITILMSVIVALGFLGCAMLLIAVRQRIPRRRVVVRSYTDYPFHPRNIIAPDPPDETNR